MAGPIVFIGTHRIQQDKLDIAKEASRELARFVQDNHPRILHFGIYIADRQREMTVVQIHPDEESLMLHMRLAGERIAASYEFLEGTVGVRIFGEPSDTFKEAAIAMGGDAPVSFESADAGFSRLALVAV